MIYLAQMTQVVRGLWAVYADPARDTGQEGQAKQWTRSGIILSRYLWLYPGVADSNTSFDGDN